MYSQFFFLVVNNTVNGKLKSRSYNTCYCLIEVVTKTGLTKYLLKQNPIKFIEKGDNHSDPFNEHMPNPSWVISLDKGL